MTQDTGYFEFIDGLPPNVLGVRAHGKITRAAYEDVLIPAFEARVATHGKVSFLYVLGPELDGFSGGAAWDDAKLGLTHLSDFERVAMVSDIEWVRLGLKMFAPLIPGEVRVFGMGELTEAEAWVAGKTAKTV